MTLMVSKALSLVEQKRLQWAKEREEMTGLCAPWGPPTNREVYRSSIRTHFLSSTELNQSNDPLNAQNFPEAISRIKRRSPSLPPIINKGAQQGQAVEAPAAGGHFVTEDEGEGETSGYASESGVNERNSDFWIQQRQAVWACQQQHQQQQQQHQQTIRMAARHPIWPQQNRGYMTPDSIMSTPPHRWSYGGSDESNRPRWGDRGVGVGHLWEPSFHEPDCRLPQVHGSERGTPSWLERGLSKLGDSQILVINHGPESGLGRELAGSCDTINTQCQFDYGRTFLRGQNVPVEPEVLLERERKRQRALEHQNAIRQQLEERDRKRKEERERRIKEEREEEERIRREQERERQRLEEEQRRQKEREEKEARKARAMREALEHAQKLARQEKIRANRKHVSESKSEDENKVTDDDQRTWYQNRPASEANIPDSSRSLAESHTSSVIVTSIKQHQVSDKKLQARSTADGVFIATDAVAMPADGLAVVLGGASEGAPGSHEGLSTPGGGVQLALLMSPSTVAANLHQQPLVLENRLLTPSKYRFQACERGTQTDTEVSGSARASRSKAKKDPSIIRKERKKSASLDRPHHGCKLPLRCRSQSQPGQTRANLEDRPKWGVNRPGTQYLKQSEKDPYYQRRLRQRLLRASIMAGGVDTGTESDTGFRRRQQAQRGSSGENSRSPSPPAINSRGLFYRQPPRHSEKNAEKRDVSVISLDLSTLDSLDNEQIGNDNKKDSTQKSYQSSTPNKRVQVVVPSQNVSQRLNENISNKKALGQPNNTANTHKHLSLKGGGSQRLLNRKSQPPASIEIKSNHKAEKWSSQDILSQLSSLREGLLIKQQEWERSQTPFSESSWQS